MGDERAAQRASEGKSEEKRPLGSPRRRWGEVIFHESLQNQFGRRGLN